MLTGLVGRHLAHPAPRSPSLAGLEEEQTGWVLMQLLDAGKVRWAKARWALPP